MALRLLTEQHLEFLSLKGGCTGKSESTLVKTPHCWKSRVALKCHIVHTKRPFFSSFAYSRVSFTYFEQSLSYFGGGA